MRLLPTTPARSLMPIRYLAEWHSLLKTLRTRIFLSLSDDAS